MYTRSLETEELFLVIAAAIAVIGILSWIGLFILRKKENLKPLCSAKITVIEKSQTAGVVWYTVEFESRERRRLRSFNPNNPLLTVGDKGTIEFRGITIQSFTPE